MTTAIATGATTGVTIATGATIVAIATGAGAALLPLRTTAERGAAGSRVRVPVPVGGVTGGGAATATSAQQIRQEGPLTAHHSRTEPHDGSNQPYGRSREEG